MFSKIKKLNIHKNILEFIGVEILFFFVSLTICSMSPFEFHKEVYKGVDSTVFQVIASGMTKGMVPYRDFFDHKGPLLYLLNFVGRILSPAWGILVIEISFINGTLLAGYYLCRKLANIFSSVMAVVFVYSSMYQYYEGGNLSEEYAVLFIAIGFYLFVSYVLRGNCSGRKIFFEGVLCGLVSLLRLNMISMWIILGAYVLIESIACKKYSFLLKSFIYFVLGMLAVIFPFVLYFRYNGAFYDMLDQTILFNIQYGAGKSNESIIDVANSFMSQTVVLAGMIATVLSVILEQRNKKNILCIFLNTVILLFSLLVLVIPGIGYSHYLMVLLPFLVFPIAIMFKGIIYTFKSSMREHSVIPMLYVVLMFVYFMGFIGISYLKICTDKSNKYSYTENQVEIVNYIKNNSSLNDEISVVGNACWIYLASERNSASKFIYQVPLWREREEVIDEYISELENNNPKLIFIQNSWAEGELLEKIREFADEKYTMDLENNIGYFYKLISKGDI